MSAEKQKDLDKLRAVLDGLTNSPLYDLRKKNGCRPVPGEGNPDARLMLIGEAPGLQEARSGRPFVGASGRLLDALLASVGLARSEVFITNIVKDRPPDNRDPTPSEISIYAPILIRQMEIIQPDVIASLGRYSMDFVLSLLDSPEAGRRITELHGKQISVQASWGKVRVVPLFHPAAAIYNPALKTTLAEDFVVLAGLMSRS